MKKPATLASPWRLNGGKHIHSALDVNDDGLRDALR